MLSPFARFRRSPAFVPALVVGSVVLFLGTPIFLRAFVVEAFQTPSGSMLPSLEIGDRFFVAKTKQLARGDVVVFRYPPEPDISYVKRVIGLPGETIAIESNQLLVDGRPLARRALDAERACSPCLWEETAGEHTYRIFHRGGHREDREPVQIPADSYFVIGDNRDDSNDSRNYGPIPADLIQGRATYIYYSVEPGPPARVRWDRVARRVD